MAFIALKGALIQAPILHYPDPSKHYIVYMDVWTMPVELNCPRNMMGKTCLSHSSHTHSQKLRGNRSSLNRKLMG